MKKTHIAIIIVHLVILNIAAGYIVYNWSSFFRSNMRGGYEKLNLTQIQPNEDRIMKLISIRNTGMRKTTVNSSATLYNDRLASDYSNEDRPRCYFEDLNLSPGDETYATLILPEGITWKPGESVTVTIHTETGNEYSVYLQLP